MKDQVKHWGQLKLFLTELQFLVEYWDNDSVPDPIIVYAGAAHGYHIPILADLFPDIREWHLYDPRNFGIRETDKIKIYQQYFTDEDADYWSSQEDNILFISDIREDSFVTLSDDKDLELSIKYDMDLQKKWVLIIDPIAASLKFRLPYSHVMAEKTMEYLDGDVLLQSFSGPTSTETRLVPFRDEEGNYLLKDYHPLHYEKALFYHNSVTRTSKIYHNPITNNGWINEGNGLNDHFDAQHFLYILGKYYSVFVEDKLSSKELLDEVLKLADYIIDKLDRSGGKRNKLLN